MKIKYGIFITTVIIQGGYKSEIQLEKSRYCFIVRIASGLFSKNSDSRRQFTEIACLCVTRIKVANQLHDASVLV